MSPVVEALRDTGFDGEDGRSLFSAIEALRIPVEYLAELFTAGDPQPVKGVLRTLAAMRAHMRSVNLGEVVDTTIADAVGMTGDEIEALYRLLAIAKYEDRYVIPSAHVEVAGQLDEFPGCSVDFESWSPQRAQGLGGGETVPVAIQSFNLARRRANADRISDLKQDDLKGQQ